MLILLKAVNEVLNDISAPVRVVSGYIGRVCVSIPWSALMRESCTVEVSGLCVTIAPSSVHYGNQGEGERRGEESREREREKRGGKIFNFNFCSCFYD